MTSTGREHSTTHFGFETVATHEKAGKVRGVFNGVAHHYDLMNDAMSLGLHRIWKDRFTEKLHHLNAESHLLDVAGGTGDIAVRLHEKTGASVTVLDINEAMLREGQNRQFDRACSAPLRYICGDAMALPIPSHTQDLYTIAFGLRNVTDIDAALSEAYRVLKPGGQFRCLEFSPVATPILKQLYDAYSFHIIPRLGAALAGNRSAYQYLAESIRMFPAAENLALRMKHAGFERVSFERLSLGVVAIHTGWKW